MDTENEQEPQPGPDSSGWNERQLEHSVEFIIGMLEQAGRGQHVAWALGNAMSSIAKRRGGPITAAQASRLKSAADRAEQGAIRHLDRFLSLSQITTGMQAMSVQIDRWNLRQVQTSIFSEDAALYARIFRNSLHNLDLCFQLCERTGKRRAEREARYGEVVSGLLRAPPPSAHPDRPRSVH